MKKLLLPEQKTDIEDYCCGIAVESKMSGYGHWERFTFAIAYRNFAGDIIFQCCNTIENNFKPEIRPRPSEVYIQQIKEQFPGIRIMKETN